jgi:hypothetical protein
MRGSPVVPSGTGTTQPSSLFAIIKINRADDPRKRARDIEEGISYACALLMDEYGFPATAIMDIAERITDEASDRE